MRHDTVHVYGPFSRDMTFRTDLSTLRFEFRLCRCRRTHYIHVVVPWSLATAWPQVLDQVFDMAIAQLRESVDNCGDVEAARTLEVAR